MGERQKISIDDVQKHERHDIEEARIKELVAVDSGGRQVEGWQYAVFIALALSWSLFQLWFASPLKYMMNEWLGNFTYWLYDIGGFDWQPNIAIGTDKGRIIHLAFAIALVFLSFPINKKASKHHTPFYDWLLMLAGLSAVMYMLVFWGEIQPRHGNPTTVDMAMGVIGLFVLLEATRRSLGPALVIIASIGIIYSLFGSASFLGDFKTTDISFRAFINQQWVTQAAVFGTPLKVSMEVVFLFVLFGALLEKAGAGSYFIRIAFSSLGHLRGGPAKAAVVASGATGLISGSSIANTVTTGTFTIPMMKKVGFSAEKSGAVEVASSVNGQIMPPVMGAAAFLMVSYIDGLEYPDIVKHAFLPAIISYIALVYIVHLEAAKNNFEILPRGYQPSPLKIFLMRLAITIIGIVLFAFIAFTIVNFLKLFLGKGMIWLVALVSAIVHVALVAYCSRYKELDPDASPDIQIPLPRSGPIFLSGLYYLLPVILLVWLLMVEKKSPELSAFWASIFLMFIIVTQRPLIAFFRKEGGLMERFKWGWDDIYQGLIGGARSMVSIALATAAAGIIVGFVDQTSLGAKISDIVEVIAGNNIILILLMTAVLSLILGMGLPTTANYIVVSTLMVPVVIELGEANGLIVPLIAAHMFCFYFGIMADVTPPVGLASFAAAAVSRGDPLKTGAIAFFYSLRTAILPFLFIFNSKLLLWNVSWVEGIAVAIVATIGILMFTAALQGWFLTKNKIWEGGLLILAAFTLFHPSFWLDRIEPRFTEYAGATAIIQQLDNLEEGQFIRMKVQPPNKRIKYLRADMEAGASDERFLAMGIDKIVQEEERLYIDSVNAIDSQFKPTQASKKELGKGTEIQVLQVENKRMNGNIFWIFGILLIAFVIILQRWRIKQDSTKMA